MAILNRQQCGCGGNGHGDEKPVRLRLPGRATAYDPRIVWLCGSCRAKYSGSWKLAKEVKVVASGTDVATW